MDLEIANAFLGFLANIVRFYAIKRLIDCFLKKDECSWNHTWVLYVIACCYTYALYEIFLNPTWNIFANLTGMLLVVLPYKVKLLKKLLIVLMIYIMNVAVDGVVVLSFVDFAVGEPLNQVYGCITSFGILFVSIILEKTIWWKKEGELPVFYEILLGAVPLVSIVCTCYLVQKTEVQQETMITISVWTLFVNVVIIYLYNALTQFYTDKIEKKVLEEMMNAYSYQLDLMKESQERVNALRHDMKHHMIELVSMIKEEENPEVIKYLKNMELFMLNPKEHVTTGNKEMDGVLNYLLQNVDEVLENIDIQINVPEEACWSDFSMSVILGNLVENAIREASKSEEKYLKINIQYKIGIVLIDIENSYSGEITEKESQIPNFTGNGHGAWIWN